MTTLNYNTILFIIGAFFAIYLLETLGLVGIILFIIIISVYKLYKKREAFGAGMSNIETMIWGKPLKKDYWKKGEMKNTKVKLGFGKSKWMTKEHWLLLIKFSGFAVLLIIIIREMIK